MVNRPLLFVKSPPAVFKEIDVFSHAQFEVDMEELKVEQLVEEETVDTVTEEMKAILETGEWRKRKEKLLFLSNPFQQKVYQPLVFIVNDGRKIPGEVYKLDLEKQQVFIRTTDDVQSIPILHLKDLLWRGKSFLDS